MRILIVHNTYQQPGGEDTVVERETALLRAAGHDLIEYRRSNSEIDQWVWWKKATLPKQMIWARDTLRDLEKVVHQTQPDIAHFHNTHFMISPAAYDACRDQGVPVVQSLYNPRLMCPSANFYRDGHLCQDCQDKSVAWPGVLHACYRNSRLQTAAVATSLSFHRWRGTWTRHVDAYITATDFYRRQYILGGLPAEKLHVKPHFVSPDPGERSSDPGDYGLFIARLDPEKGVRTLLRAWKSLSIPLKIRGSGQLLPEVEQAAIANPAIEIVGRLAQPELTDLIKGARFLVWPSEGYYETFGLVAIEAFACGVPVIGSRIGVAEEIVTDGETGLHFTAGDASDLAAKAAWAWEHPAEMSTMGHKAHCAFETRYTGEKNLDQLLTIYHGVM